MNSDLKQPVVLVTGASTGLGLALARLLLAKTGYRLILTARASSLPRFAKRGIQESDRVWLRPLDVTNGIERSAVVGEADEKWGGVDILINNAGVAYRGVVEHVSDKDRLEQMDINYRGPMDLIRLVLPRMREKRSGRIINVSSVGGMMAMPTMGAYSASKYALEGATEALWYELRPWNIKVSLIEPGFTRSESFTNTRHTELSRKANRDADDPYYSHYVNMDSLIGRFMKAAFATPDKIARRILRTMEEKNPRLRVYATIDAHVFAMLRRWLPRQVFHWFLYRQLPNIKDWGVGGLTAPLRPRVFKSERHVALNHRPQVELVEGEGRLLND